jgi:hypothetical protein
MEGTSEHPLSHEAGIPGILRKRLRQTAHRDRDLVAGPVVELRRPRRFVRRFTRLTNAFSISKKLDNHIAIIALFHMHYNFARVHQSLRVTPAMEAGLSARVWSIADIVQLTDSRGALAA